LETTRCDVCGSLCPRRLVQVCKLCGTAICIDCGLETEDPDMCQVCNDEGVPENVDYSELIHL
jgi:hypothetical protein